MTQLSAALDPALLVYDEEAWRTKKAHALERLDALGIHLARLRAKDGPAIVMSERLAAWVVDSFPWGSKTDPALRDVRQFVLSDLARVALITDDRDIVASLEPPDVLCVGVDDRDLPAKWMALLHAAAIAVKRREGVVLVATWRGEAQQKRPTAVKLVAPGRREATEAIFPLVWDDRGWAAQMATGACWPNISECVKAFVVTNPSVRRAAQRRQTPLRLTTTPDFDRAIATLTPDLRQPMIKALAKLAYGVHDKSLGLEKFQGKWRMRVTRFWRVHLRLRGREAILEEFGPHSIGGVR